MLKRISACALAFFMVMPSVSLAGPVEVAKENAARGAKEIKRAKRLRGKRKIAALTKGLKNYSEAYMLIKSRRLENDAPDLLERISRQIKDTGNQPEIRKLRQDIRAKAIAATEAGKYSEAYDQFERLRDLDPRDSSIDYAMRVIVSHLAEEQ